MSNSPIENGGFEGGRLWLFETLPSTNDWAKSHLDMLRHGDAVRAVCQTAGRGRFDREWISPAARGLTLSLVLDPLRIAPGCDARLTQAVALAVRDLCANAGLDAWVKWPNDVAAGERKIAGLLAEKRSDVSLVVIGVGINVNLARSDLAGHPWGPGATSLRIETGRDHDVAGIETQLMTHTARMVEEFRRGGAGWLAKAWAAHDRLRGRSIALQTSAGTVSGEYAGMSDSGDLLLKTREGALQSFTAGDVTLRGPDA